MSRAARVCDAGAVNVHRIRFEGPTALAVGVATALADADGVDLTSSASPTALGDGAVALEMVVEATDDDAAAAVDAIRRDLPAGASIERSPG